MNNLNIKYFIFSIVIALLSFSACKEDPIELTYFGSIKGIVLDEMDEAIANATITTTPPSEVITTDIDGKFTLEKIKTGTYSLRAKKDGYIADLESITVNQDQISNVNFVLKLDDNQNQAPSIASYPTPENESQNIDYNIELRWTAEDPDGNEELRFDVLLVNPLAQTDSLVAVNLVDSSFMLSGLNFNTKYYWQVVTKDEINDPVYGPIWNFTTRAFPNHRYLFVKDNNGKFDIFSSDGADETILLSNNTGSNWRPRLSPDRKRIAFISNLGIESQIYIMNRDGSEIRKLTTTSISGNNNFELDFSWSPNSSQILYMNNNRLYKINIDGTGLDKIADAPEGQNFTACDWNAANNRIIVRTTGPNHYDNDIFLMESDGTYIRKVVANTIGTTGNPQFSIDGNTILYTKDISGYQSFDNRQLDTHIFLLNLNTLAQTDLSTNKPDGTNDLEARFSPTGAEVIFTNTPNDGISQKNIYTINLSGGNRKLLFNNALMPDWK